MVSCAVVTIIRLQAMTHSLDEEARQISKFIERRIMATMRTKTLPLCMKKPRSREMNGRWHKTV